MTPPRVRAVPLLPCRSIADVVDLAVALGFEITYEQADPQPYAALRDADGMELHYFVVPDLRPEDSYGAILIAVPDPAVLLDRWTSGLVDYFGAVPNEGFPRLIAPRGDTGALVGFSLVDPAGNRIRVVRDAEHEDVADEPDLPDDPLAPPDPGSAVTSLPPPRVFEVVTESTPSSFERHGVAAAPHHRFAALIYLAELSVRLGRLDEARTHLRAAETIDPDAPALAQVRVALEAREVELDA